MYLLSGNTIVSVSNLCSLLIRLYSTCTNLDKSIVTRCDNTNANKFNSIHFNSIQNQADISVHGHDMFSAYSMGVLFVTNTHMITHAGTSSSLLYKT